MLTLVAMIAAVRNDGTTPSPLALVESGGHGARTHRDRLACAEANRRQSISRKLATAAPEPTCDG